MVVWVERAREGHEGELCVHTYWGEEGWKQLKSLWGFREKSYTFQTSVRWCHFPPELWSERSQLTREESIHQSLLVWERGMGRNAYYWSDIFWSRILNHFNPLTHKEEKSFMWFLQFKREPTLVALRNRMSKILKSFKALNSRVTFLLFWKWASY